MQSLITTPEGEVHRVIVTLGIDLAKNVLALHGVDATGKAVLVRPKVARSNLVELIAQLPPCLIGMEACSGAHHWARVFAQHGHIVRLMAPKFVAPYRLSGKSGKNDAADAQAICEAVTRPQMRFVPVKTLQQQGQLMVHRVRQGFVQQRTTTFNRIRGLLSEAGIVLPLKANTVRRQACEHLESLPGWANISVEFTPRAKPGTLALSGKGISLVTFLTGLAVRFAVCQQRKQPARLWAECSCSLLTGSAIRSATA